MNAEAYTSYADEILYHHTSFEAFRSIVGCKTVWATECKYLNDSTELQYGLKLADEVFESSSANLSSAAERFIKNADRNLYTYVFSLSRQGDLLSQWRAYCPNGVVSIGFSKGALERLAKQQNFSLVACIYDREKQVEKIKEIMEKETDDDSFYQEFPRALVSLKHPAFSEEEEYRLISKSNIYEQQIYETKWRATLTMLVQYTEVSLMALDSSELKRKYPELSSEKVEDISSFGNGSESAYGLEPFRRVIVGPSANQELVQKAVNDFAADNIGYGRSGRNPRGLVTVNNSKTPHRSK